MEFYSQAAELFSAEDSLGMWHYVQGTETYY